MAQPVARVADKTKCPAAQPAPHVSGKLRNNTPVCASANERRVIRLADLADCKPGNVDVVFEGAATVTLCGLPVARVKDAMMHGGSIAVGSGDVVIGGPSFRIPPVIRLWADGATPDPAFVNRTVRDLYKLSTTPSGRNLFQRLAAAHQPVVIRPGSDGCDPLNYNAAVAHQPTGSIVNYNPDFGVSVPGTSGQLIDIPPTVALGHELVHALDNAEGHQIFGPDPAGPMSNVPGVRIEAEEAQAIGVGSYSGSYPSENSFRRDLGLSERADHDFAWPRVAGSAIDLRPGDCK